jgi:hypothetical protein
MGRQVAPFACCDGGRRRRCNYWRPTDHSQSMEFNERSLIDFNERRLIPEPA